jgi:hypothetical protein
MLKALRSPDGADEEIRSSICDPYFERPFRVATVYHPDGRRCDYLIDRGSSMAHETMVWFLAIACPCTWRWAAVCDAVRFLPARVHWKYTKHLVSIAISTFIDK